MKSLDETQAREIVLFRISQAQEPGGPPPLRLFAEQIQREGLTGWLLSTATINSLLTGRMYPALRDRDGNAFEWSKVPRRQCGRCTTSERPQTTKGRLALLEQQVADIQRRLS